MKKTLARAEDLAEIRQRIGQLTAEDPRRWGSLSVGEMVCHVRDSYEAPLGRRKVSTAARRPPIPRGLFKWLALSLPREWPKGVPTMPEVNPHLAGTRPAEFDADLQILLRRLDEFAVCSGPFAPHPFFGAMSHGEWKRWGYLHADHHLRQFGR